MPAFKNLLEQLDAAGKTAYETVALLVGVEQPGSAFNCACLDCSPLPAGWTIGDAAEHYLTCRLEVLRNTPNSRSKRKAA